MLPAFISSDIVIKFLFIIMWYMIEALFSVILVGDVIKGM